MIKLLEGVNAGRYESVLCMDIDRLGRGGMAVRA
jgi:DNA invertase Pin-like site-specific DNA recombinase